METERDRGPEISGSAELERKQSCFIGSLDNPLFKDTKGYLMGWFMRDKTLSEGGEVLIRDDVECAVMGLPEINLDPPHYHKLATELTYCISGRLHMIVGDSEFDLEENQFMVIPPNVFSQNPTNAPGTKIFVVKVPSVPDDKFYE